MKRIFIQNTPSGKKIIYNHPIIMGILNLSKDSFYDGGKYADVDKALRHVKEMISYGADIIDIGGESTRPGAEAISAEEEMERILPVIEKVKKNFDTIISVDTYKSQVAEEALKLGVDIINDISGFTFDDKMPEVVRRYRALAVLMHIKGKPKDMQNNPEYDNVVKEVYNFLSNSVKIAIRSGIPKENLIIDVGIGFGKKLVHNIELIKNISYFRRLNLPILIGVSRKSMIGMLLGDTDKMDENVRPPAERLYGTIGINLFCYLNGVDIFRVHDVKENFEALKVVSKIVMQRL